VNFPFIISFIRCFKDEYDILFFQEYVKGKDLYDVLKELGLLNPNEA
jgi:cGMP-dependent protein kinase